MMSLSYILKEMLIGAVSCLLLVSMVGTLYLPDARIHKADAGGGGIVFDPSNFAKNVITSVQTTITAVANTMLRLKELVLDPIAWTVTNMVIQRMTQDLVRWINSGFQGKPAFMQDFGGFMTSIADNAVGQFISSDETLRFLCSPFQLDVRLALSIQYAKSRNYGSPGSACTFTGVAANLDKFFERGAFAGGWDQWFKVTQDPQYNPHGALLLAQEQMSVRIGNMKGEQATMLGWGKGFLSSQECTRVDNREMCRTVTPGTTIEEALNDALGNPSKRIAVADEINEVLAALFSQLVTQAFNGAGGLLGLTGGGGNQTGYSYFNELTQQTLNSGQSKAGTIEDAIVLEQKYRSLMQSLIGRIESAATYKDATYGPGNTCHTGNLTADLQDALTKAKKGFETAENNIATLTVLLNRYNAAVGQPNQLDLQSEILQEYLSLQSTATLHSSGDIQITEQTYIPQVNTWIDGLTSEIDTECNRGGGGGGGGMDGA